MEDDGVGSFDGSDPAEQAEMAELVRQFETEDALVIGKSGLHRLALHLIALDDVMPQSKKDYQKPDHELEEV